MRLFPVFYVPDLHIRLMSFGQILLDGVFSAGSAEHIDFHDGHGALLMRCAPHMPGQTIHWCTTRIAALEKHAARQACIYKVDYQTWHQRFGHPRKDVLRQAPKACDGFPKDLKFPERDTPCRSCAEGKMRSDSFPSSTSRASYPFELIHSDLKEFPTLSYHKYKYYISFLDDHSGRAWAILLKKKSDAADAIQIWHKLMVTQYAAKVKQW